MIFNESQTQIGHKQTLTVTAVSIFGALISRTTLKRKITLCALRYSPTIFCHLLEKSIATPMLCKLALFCSSTLPLYIYC